MKILADTSLFIKFHRRLPLPSAMEAALDAESTKRFLATVSIIELFRLWKEGRLPDNPDDWLDDALDSWTILPLTVPIARQSVLWDWTHKDPADRILAATAQVEQVELWHTDTILKTLRGFPQRYFANKLRPKTRKHD